MGKRTPRDCGRRCTLRVAPTSRAVHHFGVEVDDFEAAYREVKEIGVGNGEGHFSNVYELPDGAVQLCVRDPAGNMVEINRPGSGTLDRAVVPEIQKVPGSPDARLYLRR